ncbi:MAG: NADH-quinone oxidoreductase subunit I [Ignavibacteria bacterium GWA2_35_9]|nr:MAG: NADH-quinone oxidoreductase subunit I [Ignavibacteria bacterium GWA2_35_9]OGU48228.1 MAG: NADH-quinone oxidoreductase subunit I [Ignavibacteria bacterium GWB2_36_8]OGU53629.1 MAG: NADH-quinone oxidoreductase subunit I [Ignavibacteria bacterium GWC2_36_12]OGU98737.1 MAG: NADH-quinone oxidoreductase subunit I [Ignavibacteria bacterium RIFOXYB2_FULL_36_7]
MSVKRREKDLTLLEKIYIPEIVKGLSLTLKSMFKPKFTLKYPEEKFIPPASYRGRPVLVQEKDGHERCVACGLCSRVCPSLAIEVQAAETELEKERYPEKFEINMIRCIFCGFCEEVCPEEAIVMSKDYEMAFTNREEAIYGKDKLLVPVEQLQDRIDFLRKYK